jgi:ABC-2 type transport system permease protein
MNAFASHFGFEFRTGIRNKTLLMMNYLFPLGFYLAMGFIMAEINPTFREDIVPAMVIFAILAAMFLGVPDQIVSARENGILRSYRINGVPATSVISIPALTTTLHMVIVAAIVTVTGPLMFRAPAPTNWLNFVIVFAAMALSSAGLSVLIGVVSPSSRMTVLWSQLVFLPSMLLGGMMVPYSWLPGAAGKVAQLLPATHAMNAFNGLAMGKTADFAPWGSVIVLAASGVLAFGLALYLFSWDSRNAGRRGHPLLGLLCLLPFVVGMVVL